MRPGTHLAPILLPEVIVPGSRVPRQVQEPVSEEQDGGMTLGMVGGEGAYSVVQPLRRGRASKKGQSKKDVAPTTAAGGSRGRTLKLNGPAPEIPIAAVDEERYCYCNQVSFGEVCVAVPPVLSETNDYCRWWHVTTIIVNVNGCASFILTVIIVLTVLPVPFGLCRIGQATW